jgi:XTP/dITP diphosphohydrolase
LYIKKQGELSGSLFLFFKICYNNIIIFMKLIFATHNPGKLKEIKEILLDWEILSLDDVGISEDIIEDGNTFAENALIKARFVVQKIGAWAFADDSGVCIKALNGAPGILSARWAEGDEGKIKLILEKLKDVPVGEREAYMEAAVALVAPDGKEWIFNGRIDGNIVTEPRGINRPHLPYDLIFEPLGETRTLAEMSHAEKNKISHRGMALRRLKEFLETQDT